MTLPSTSPWSDGPLPVRHAPASALASLMAALQERIALLYARQHAPLVSSEAVAADEGRAIWTLHVLGSAYCALSALDCARIPQPDQVLAQLQQLAASLLSMAPAPAPAAPADGAARDAAFARVDAQIRSLLARAPGAESSFPTQVAP